MAEEIIFEQLEEKERILLLKAFDYDIDEDGYVLDNTGNRIRSNESPSEFIKLNESALIPGSLKIIDGTPTSISKFIRERVDSSGKRD